MRNVIFCRMHATKVALVEKWVYTFIMLLKERLRPRDELIRMR